MTRVFVLLFALAGTASLAAAQTPAVDVRTAFGASNYLHGDIEYIATFESSFNRFKTNSTAGPRPGVQIVGGVDFSITDRIRAFGQGRYEMRSFQDPGGGSVVQGFAGVAIALF